MSEYTGVPFICLKCKKEQMIRLRKGVKIKSIICEGCGFSGTLHRYTDFDKERPPFKRS